MLWLERDPNAKLMRKDCINGFVGGIQKDGSNIVLDWIKNNKVQQVRFVSLSFIICMKNTFVFVRSEYDMHAMQLH